MYMDHNVTDRSNLVKIISDLAQNLSVKQQHDIINYINFIKNGDEKRNALRKAVMVGVDYSVKDDFYSDLLENISAGEHSYAAKGCFRLGIQ
jgi:hypothetical protein